MAKTKKRKTVRTASVFYMDQLPKLDIIAESQDKSRAQLIRDFADAIITENTDLLEKSATPND